MRDKAYRRDLRRAVQQVVPLKTLEVMKSSHLRLVVEIDGADREFTASGSPRDHQHAVDQVVRYIKRAMKK